jgi:hypothetical protein
MKTSKSMKEIVCFFYGWKRTPRYEPIYSQYARVYQIQTWPSAGGGDPITGAAKKMHPIESFTQQNILNVMPPPRVSAGSFPKAKKILDGPCFHCVSPESDTWHKLPYSLDLTSTKPPMCDLCHKYFVKYACMRPLTGQQLVAGKTFY